MRIYSKNFVNGIPILYFDDSLTLLDAGGGQVTNVCVLSAVVLVFGNQPMAVLRRAITRRACARDGRRGKYVDSLKAI